MTGGLNSAAQKPRSKSIAANSPSIAKARQTDRIRCSPKKAIATEPFRTWRISSSASRAAENQTLQSKLASLRREPGRSEISRIIAGARRCGRRKPRCQELALESSSIGFPRSRSQAGIESDPTAASQGGDSPLHQQEIH